MADMTGLIKKSFTLNGHRTSVALEPAFWTHLHRMAAAQTITALVMKHDLARTPGQSLASALRLAVLADLSQDTSIHMREQDPS